MQGIRLLDILKIAEDLHRRFPPTLTSSKLSSDPVAVLSPSTSPSIPLAASTTSFNTAGAEDPDLEQFSQDISSQLSTRTSDSAQNSHSLKLEELLGPASVIFTWSESQHSYSPSASPHPPQIHSSPSSAPVLPLTDDAAEQLVEHGLVDVIVSAYDGSSDRDLREYISKEAPGKEREAWERRQANEAKRRKEERQRTIIRSGLGMSVAILVGVSAMLLYTADYSLASVSTGGVGPGSGSSKTLGGWLQTTAWAADYIIGLGERVVGPM
jgi:hypothetical protein